jgi:hypothetical protein
MRRGHHQSEQSAPGFDDQNPAPFASPVEAVRETLCSSQLLSAQEAARGLGITASTLYGWLGLSKNNLLILRGQSVTIDYLQGGPKGQGRIRLEAREVARLKELLRVQPQHRVVRRPPARQSQFPGITVPLGRPRQR